MLVLTELVLREREAPHEECGLGYPGAYHPPKPTALLAKLVATARTGVRLGNNTTADGKKEKWHSYDRKSDDAEETNDEDKRKTRNAKTICRIDVDVDVAARERTTVLGMKQARHNPCLLYTSDAADE